MKALSIIQPWASLIIDGRKEYETRSWATGFTGLLAIHASKGMDRDTKEALAELSEEYPGAILPLDLIPRGAVLGIVEMIGCYPMTVELCRSISLAENDFGYWAVGRFAWKMRVVEKFETPIPAKGSLGFWEWER